MPPASFNWDLFLDRYATVDVAQRHLPHWRQEGKLYFVTWRLADSLPQERLEELARSRRAWMEECGAIPLEGLNTEQYRRYVDLFHARIQEWLDKGSGACVLRNERAQEILSDALHHFEGIRYELGSFAIAANHVHVLVVPTIGIALSEILHSWKSFTANAINRMLGSAGPLWQNESYDHLVRNELSLARIETYIHAHAARGAYVERHRLF